MTQGLQTTFAILADTETEAASRVLIAALESTGGSVRRAALEAILRRRNAAGHRELVNRWDRFDPSWKELVKQHTDRMTDALRAAVLSGDALAAARGCRAAVYLQAYDLIPSLGNALGEPLDPNNDLLAESLFALSEQLYQDLATSPELRDSPGLELARQHAVSALEGGLQRYNRHRRREVVEAFLLLVVRDNVVLKQVLQDPHHAAFLIVLDVLGKSTRGGVLRLLLSFLDDPHAPSAALCVAGSRCDMAFIPHLLRKVEREPSTTVKQNLKRVTIINWLRSPEGVVPQLDEAGQQAAVRLALASGIERNEVFALLDFLLRRGRPGGRRAAAEALAEFQGAQANALALRTLDDPDPGVQAAIVPQLRHRGIAGIMPRLVGMLESPHVAVRQAARKCLAEFSFKRFLAAFDMLDEEVRRSTGLLVRKIDPQTSELLQAELESPLRVRRIRGLAVARVIEAVGDLEPHILSLLGDDDHLVRIEAADALGAIRSDESRQALEDALSDRSPAVQEAARLALQRRNQYPLRPAAGPIPQQ